MADMDKIDVSIIIVNWNTCDITCQCLQSVFEQTKGVGYEIMVIDNASSDDSVEMIKTRFSQVKLIENSENLGFSAANNQGIDIAKGRYFLLLNSDTILLDDAISSTVAFADKTPKAAATGCHVLNADKTLQPTCFMFPSLMNMLIIALFLNKLFPKSKLFGRERMTWWDRKDVREVDVVSGCFMLIRREAIERAGKLDEDFYIYSEEVELCYRFRALGLKNYFTPAGTIVHLAGVSTNQIKPRMMLQLRAGMLLFFKKHRNLPSYIMACCLVSLFFALRVPYWFIKALVNSKSRGLDFQICSTYIRGAFRALFGWRGLCSRG